MNFAARQDDVPMALKIPLHEFNKLRKRKEYLEGVPKHHEASVLQLIERQIVPPGTYHGNNEEGGVERKEITWGESASRQLEQLIVKFKVLATGDSKELPILEFLSNYQILWIDSAS